MHRKPLLWIAALALAAALGLTAQASAATVKGTVVHVNKRAHTFVVASRSGRLTTLSSRRLARPGSVVRVSAKRLRNGTLKAKRIHASAHRRHARLRGIVTWASKRGFTVASGNTSLLVHKSSSNSGEPVGTPVQADVTIDDQGDLNDDDVTQVGSPPSQIELEGIVLSTDTAAQTITLSGDDDQEDAGAQASDDQGGSSGDDNQGDENGTQPAIVVHVPDATKFAVGDKVELIVTGPAADGSFTLVSVDEQEGQNGDDNQGDDNPGTNDGESGSSGSGENSGSDD